MRTGSPNFTICFTKYSPDLGSVNRVQLSSTGSIRRKTSTWPRAVDEVLWPAREIWHVLGLVVFDEESRVLKEVIDVVPRERPTYSEDDLRVSARWRGGVHDDFPFNHFSMDVIGEQFDDVVRGTHAT
jgi:hypothetical protein